MFVEHRQLYASIFGGCAVLGIVTKQVRGQAMCILEQVCWGFYQVLCLSPSLKNEDIKMQQCGHYCYLLYSSFLRQ